MGRPGAASNADSSSRIGTGSTSGKANTSPKTGLGAGFNDSSNAGCGLPYGTDQTVATTTAPAAQTFSSTTPLG